MEKPKPGFSGLDGIAFFVNEECWSTMEFAEAVGIPQQHASHLLNIGRVIGATQIKGKYVIPKYAPVRGVKMGQDNPLQRYMTRLVEMYGDEVLEIAPPDTRKTRTYKQSPLKTNPHMDEGGWVWD